MQTKLLIDGMRSGIKSMGSELSKVDEKYFYVTIVRGSELDKESSIQRLKEFIQKTFSGYGLKVKKVDSLKKSN